MTVDAIWLTHGHIDHAAGAMELKDKLGVEIIGPHMSTTRRFCRGWRNRRRCSVWMAR